MQQRKDLVVPVGAETLAVWDEADRLMVHAFAMLFEEGRGNPELRNDWGALDGDLLEYSDGTIHRFAEVGLAGNLILAPCVDTAPTEGGFELIGNGDLIYKGLAYDGDEPAEITPIDTGQTGPAVAWANHHDIETGPKVSFTMPVRRWTVDVPAPTSPDLFAYSGW